jgi:hypothetical protein
MYTGPAYTFTNVFGNTYQAFIVAFLLSDYTGDLVPDPEEATEAGFYGPDDMPSPLARSVTETLADLASFVATGVIVVK